MGAYRFGSHSLTLDADITSKVVPPQLETFETRVLVCLQQTRNPSTWERAPYSASHLTLNADIILEVVPPQLETLKTCGWLDWVKHSREQTCDHLPTKNSLKTTDSY